ncbi:aldehyde dehydrogenase [Pseudomonas putida]|uniref:Aldehyde dehydrogenase n=1 Tax=Pseudomonas putida TaxID=303 RepID=A0A1L7NF82_PSEPU|nr:aldehyde dehydrogenase [Pseudomonas putida]BAW24120.1 aldehyde dehydrogenase [Pseudomonas putida]
MTQPIAHLRTPCLSHPDKLFIAGHWVAPSTGGRIEVVSAYSEEVIATVGEAREADVDRAVVAARRAFDNGPWPRLSHLERAEWLRKLSEALAPRLPEIAQAWCEQIGALASVSPFVVGAGHHWLNFYSDLAARYPFEEDRTPTDGKGRAIVIHEPVGVVAAIAPWNNPFGIMTGKIAPALLAGCTVIMKPAPETPIEAYIIAEAAEQIGLPPGVLNLVTAHRETADHLVRNPGVDKVSFTGSVAAGQRIATVCGQRIGRYTLELGGKSAAIVLDDYDIGQAAKVLASTITLSAGQVCATLSRAIVSRKRQAQLVEALSAELEAIRIGDPYDSAAQMGPLAMERQRARVEEYISIGQREGANLASGGRRPQHLSKGYYLEPTLFSGVERGMRIAQEEIFGPVLAVIPCDDEEDAIQIANDSPFGLYGAVFTNDSVRAYNVARGVRTGTVSQNAFRFDPSLPFGGFKLSGVGREGGAEGLAAYTELKSVLLV